MSITNRALCACLSVALVLPGIAVAAPPTDARQRNLDRQALEADARGNAAINALRRDPEALPMPPVLPVAPAAPLAPSITGPSVTLAQGTAINFRTMNTLSSKVTKTGERFELTVAEPVFVGNQMVIPSGSRGVGEVTRVVKKGAFGRSGKLDVRLLYVTVGEQRVALSGQSNVAGSGGTAGTVVVAVLAGVFSAFVTGKSAEYEPGTLMTAYVDGNTQFAAAAPVVAATPVAAAPLFAPAVVFIPGTPDASASPVVPVVAPPR